MLIKDEEGKEMILSYLNQGDFIGELGLFEEGQNVAHGYVRKPPVKWLKFRTKISPIDSGKPGHSDASVCTDGASSASHFRESGQPGVPRRDGPHCTDSAEPAKQPDAMTHPDGMQIKITRQEIGQIVGCSRETVGRILKMLEDQNLISAHGKTIVVYGTR